MGYLANQTAQVAPGKSAALTIGANNATNEPQKVKVQITAPSGVTISPSSATIEVPPHGTGHDRADGDAAAGTTQNFYSAPVTLTTESTGPAQSLNQTVLVASPGSLLSTFNNAGISDSGDAAPPTSTATVSATPRRLWRRTGSTQASPSRWTA